MFGGRCGSIGHLKVLAWFGWAVVLAGMVNVRAAAGDSSRVWYFPCPYAIISADFNASGGGSMVIRASKRWLLGQASGQGNRRQVVLTSFDQQTGGLVVADAASRQVYRELLAAAMEQDLGTCASGEKVLRFLTVASSWPLGMGIQGTFFAGDPLTGQAPLAGVDSACSWPPLGVSSDLCPQLNSLHRGDYMVQGQWISDQAMFYPLACNSFDHTVGPGGGDPSAGGFGRCGVTDPDDPAGPGGLRIYTQKCFNYHGCLQSRGEADPLCRQMYLYAVSDMLFAPDCSCVDRDGDGAFAAEQCGTPPDCDDTDAAVHPGAAEDCWDGIDNDCNGLVDGDDPACADKVYLIGDYYPLNQGFTWLRRKSADTGSGEVRISEFVSGREMMDGTPYIKRNEYLPDGRYSYLDVDSAGIERYAVRSEHPWGTSRENYSPLETLYPAELRLGGSYHCSGNLTYSDTTGGTGSGVYDRTVSVEAVEDVTVAGGHYPGCLRIHTVEERRLRGHLYNDTVAERQVWVSRVVWLARDVGEVRCESRRVVVDDGQGVGERTVSELDRYDPRAHVYRMASYYPLTSGLFLRYQATTGEGVNSSGYSFSAEIAGSENLGSRSVIKKVFDSGDSSSYSLLTATDGIRRWRKHYDLPWGSFDFFDTGGNRFFPPEMVPGARYRAEMQTRYSDSKGGAGSGWLSLETTLQGVEDLVTPAGKFESCLKLKTEFTGVLHGDLYNHTVSEQSESDDDTLWLAQGIGPVKRRIKTTLTNDGIQGVYVTSYELFQVDR